MSVKTSELPELNINDIASNDYLPIVDTSEEILKKVKYAYMSGTLMYGISNSNSSNKYKEVTLTDPNYIPKQGDMFRIELVNRNTWYQNNVELNINSTGSRIVSIKGTMEPIGNIANMIICWNGQYYELIASDISHRSMLSEEAQTLTYPLTLQVGEGPSYQFGKVQSNMQLYFPSQRVSVVASNWSTTSQSGYYTNTITIGFNLTTYVRPIIFITGQNDNLDYTYEQKIAYDMIDKIDLTLGEDISQITFKSKVRPTTTFYVIVQGLYLK